MIKRFAMPLKSHIPSNKGLQPQHELTCLGDNAPYRGSRMGDDRIFGN